MDKDFCTALLRILTNMQKQLNIMELYRLGTINKDSYLKLQLEIKELLDDLQIE
jgi:hypothetical protein